MAFLFNEKEFENELLEKAKRCGFDITYELEQFRKYHQIQYLYIVKKYIDTLRGQDIPITLRMRGVSSQIAYLLDIHRVHPYENALSSDLFFEMEYEDGGIGPRFDINVPRRDKDYAIRILNNVSEIDVDRSNASVFFLKETPNYRIGIYGNALLERTVDAIHFVNCDTSVINWFKEEFLDLNDKDTLNFMLEEDHKGFLLA